MCFGYAAIFVVVAFLTRARSRRWVASVVGGFVAGAYAAMAAAIGQAFGFWQISLAGSVSAATILYVAVAVSCTPIPLLSWRVARRYGRWGLVAMVWCAAVVGPIRDYRVAAAMPEWMAFAPGLAPVLGVAATYAGIVVVGHATMFGIAGPSAADDLARTSAAA
jgi:hypothetical protein